MFKILTFRPKHQISVPRCTNANWRNLRLLESLEINICKNPLNRVDGIYWPHEYLNLALKDKTYLAQIFIFLNKVIGLIVKYSHILKVWLKRLNFKHLDLIFFNQSNVCICYLLLGIHLVTRPSLK